MKIVRELKKNYKATYSLKKRYYYITSAVGVLSVSTGLAIMMILVIYVAPMFGFNPDVKLPGNAVEKFAIVIIMILLFIACIYAGVIITAGSFAYVMYRMGNFTKSEAINYALYSGYPEYWFEKRP